MSGDPIATRNPLRYRGYYYDNETQLYYLPARYYNPDTARFLSVDPAPPSAGDPTTLNGYAYCVGDPVQFEDPDGRAAIMDGDDGWHAQDSKKAMSRARTSKNTWTDTGWSVHGLSTADYGGATIRVASAGSWIRTEGGDSIRLTLTYSNGVDCGDAVVRTMVTGVDSEDNRVPSVLTGDSSAFSAAVIGPRLLSGQSRKIHVNEYSLESMSRIERLDISVALVSANGNVAAITPEYKVVTLFGPSIWASPIEAQPCHE